MPGLRSPLWNVTLTSITDHAARIDIEAHISDREARLIAESFDKAHKAPHVSKVARQAYRGTNGTGALMASALHQPQKAEKIHIGSQREGSQHVFLGQSLGRLSSAGIAEAAGA